MISRFKLNSFAQQATFMNQQYGSQSETWFYSQTNFETSPLNRAEKTMAAGFSWVGSDRGMETKYWNNTTTDDKALHAMIIISNYISLCIDIMYDAVGLRALWT